MAERKRILLPQPIEQEAVSVLRAAHVEIVTAPDKKAEIVGPLLKGVQGVILRTGVVFNKDLLSQADELQVISRTGAGVDNVDVPAASRMGILVTVVPGANTRSVVEHALTLIMSLMKQIPLMDREVRRDNFAIRFKNLPRDLYGKTLGLVGLGRIGSELARVCRQAFNMHILAYDPYVGPGTMAAVTDWVEFCDMEKLFREADVISLHIPFSPETQRMIGAPQLSWMKPDAFLVNTSRGGVIEESALVQSLKERKIAGAGLDVFAKEPLPEDSPLKRLDNVILTPHTAALTRECVARVAVEAAQAVLDVFQGKKPEGLVNPEVLTQQRWQGLTKV